MQSIRIPTDYDLQQYPHVFLSSPDTWDASGLDHGITASLLNLRKSTKIVMTPSYRDLHLMNSENSTPG